MIHRRAVLASLLTSPLALLPGNPSDNDDRKPGITYRRIFRESRISELDAVRVPESRPFIGKKYWLEIKWKDMRPGDKIVAITLDDERGQLYEIHTFTVAESVAEPDADGIRSVIAGECRDVLGTNV